MSCGGSEWGGGGDNATQVGQSIGGREIRSGHTLMEIHAYTYGKTDCIVGDVVENFSWIFKFGTPYSYEALNSRNISCNIFFNPNNSC